MEKEKQKRIGKMAIGMVELDLKREAKAVARPRFAVRGGRVVVSCPSG